MFARLFWVHWFAVFAIDDKVGDYEIIAKLKAGGMATLFLGRRSGAAGFSQHVAIKVVHEHLASDPTFVQMFVDEALLSAQIHHPNVVHVEQLKQVQGRYFLVMEYVHGCSLAQLSRELRKRKRTMSPDLAVYLAVKVAEGLHAAHTASDPAGMPLGVVHRDVSPQNVLVAFKGHVKLIDFGVAKAAGRASQTTGGSLKGKIRYMSPEQAVGGDLDARTDVYALGVVLWEMLTNRRAFNGKNDFALLEQVRNPNVAPARHFNPLVPEALDAVIRKAMARHKEDRFESAQAFRKALAKSVPGAMALDDSDLQQLVSTVMAADLAEAIEMLPESVSGVALKPAGESGDEALLTLTVSAAGLSEPTEPTARHVSEATFQPARPVLPPPVPRPAKPARRGPLFVVLGVLAFVFVALATFAGVAVLRSTRPEIRAVPLPGVRAVAEDPASGEVDPDPVVDEPAQRDSPESDAPSAEPAANETAAQAETETDTPGLPEEAAAPVRQAAPPSTERPRRVRPGRRRVPPTRTTPTRSDPGGVFLTDDF